MEDDAKKTEQGEVAPLDAMEQGELSSRRDNRPQNDHSHPEPQPDDRDGRDILQRNFDGDEASPPDQHGKQGFGVSKMGVSHGHQVYHATKISRVLLLCGCLCLFRLVGLIVALPSIIKLTGVL